MTANEMNELINDRAIELLGEYAYNALTGHKLTRRINRLKTFIRTHGMNVEVWVNNSWSHAPGNYKKSMHLGGTTYKYQLWAVVPEDTELTP